MPPLQLFNHWRGICASLFAQAGAINIVVSWGTEEGARVLIKMLAFRAQDRGSGRERNGRRRFNRLTPHRICRPFRLQLLA